MQKLNLQPIAPIKYYEYHTAGVWYSISHKNVANVLPKKWNSNIFLHKNLFQHKKMPKERQQAKLITNLKRGQISEIWANMANLRSSSDRITTADGLEFCTGGNFLSAPAKFKPAPYPHEFEKFCQLSSRTRTRLDHRSLLIPARPAPSTFSVSNPHSSENY